MASISRSWWGQSSRLLSNGMRSLGLTNRNLTNVAISTLYMFRWEEIKMQPGDVYIEKNMGAAVYSKLLSDPGMTLVKISYCQRSLSSLSQLSQTLKKDSKARVTDARNDEEEEIEKTKDLINHDFLILELQTGDSQTQKICIMAHKLSGGSEGEEEVGSEAGIHVEFLKPRESQKEYDHDDVRLYSIECNTKPIPLQTIVDAWTKEDANYSVRDANCWDYARATTEWLLDECIERASSPGEKVRLQEERDHLTLNLIGNHIPNTAEKMKDWIKEKTRAV